MHSRHFRRLSFSNFWAGLFGIDYYRSHTHAHTKDYMIIRNFHFSLLRRYAFLYTSIPLLSSTQTPKRHPVCPQLTSDTYSPSLPPPPPPRHTPLHPPNPILQAPPALELASVLLSTPFAFCVDGTHDFEAVAHMGDDVVIAHCDVLQHTLCDGW